MKEQYEIDSLLFGNLVTIVPNGIHSYTNVEGPYIFSKNTNNERYTEILGEEEYDLKKEKNYKIKDNYEDMEFNKTYIAPIVNLKVIDFLTDNELEAYKILKESNEKFYLKKQRVIELFRELVISYNNQKEEERKIASNFDKKTNNSCTEEELAYERQFIRSLR